MNPIPQRLVTQVRIYRPESKRSSSDGDIKLVQYYRTKRTNSDQKTINSNEAQSPPSPPTPPVSTCDSLCLSPSPAPTTQVSN